MLKDATYAQKFEMLTPYMPTIIEVIKKDLKGNHLPSDRLFFKKYFAGKVLKKLTTDDLVEAYHQEIASGAEDLGEFIANRWLLKNTEVYEYFAGQLEKINPQFDEIDTIDAEQAEEMITEAVKQFGAVASYIFTVLNSVVFPEEKLKALETQSQKETEEQKKQMVSNDEERTIAALEKKCERELSRLKDRQEKKMTGMEKKYDRDVAALKKQISTLQRKLNEQSGAVC